MSWFRRWQERKVYRFARGIAKAKLRTLKSLKKQHPEATKRELYFLTIIARTGYNENLAIQIMQGAEEQAKMTGELFNFRMIVFGIIIHETPTSLDNSLLPEIMSAIDDTIPDNL